VTPKTRDYYGGHAADYQQYRPTYPNPFIRQLVELAPDRDFAWDCGTGNGQVAVRLAEDFQSVLGTDLSSLQLEQARPHPQVTYRCCEAHDSGLEEQSASLVTVGTAVHWFDLDPFYEEVVRVLKPGGLLAVWTYGPDLVAPPELGKELRELAQGVLRDYWPPGIEWVNKQYTDLPFPFPPLELEPVPFLMNWNFEDLWGWIDTWSAVRRYREREGKDPLAGLRPRLKPYLADSGPLQLPLYFKVGRKN